MPEDLHIWPPLSNAYQDVFGEIDLDVYNAAGEIWQRGRTFAHSHGIDDAITHTAMIHAVAKVSHRLKQPAPDLNTAGALKAYLFTALEGAFSRKSNGSNPQRFGLKKFSTPIGQEDALAASSGKALSAGVGAAARWLANLLRPERS